MEGGCRGEVVRVGGKERGGVGVGGNEKIEEAGGYNGALWDSASDVVWEGSGLVVPTGGRTATQIGGQPPDGIVIEGGVGDGGEEFGVVHDVKGL